MTMVGRNQGEEDAVFVHLTNCKAGVLFPLLLVLRLCGIHGRKGRQNGNPDPFSGSGKWGHDKFEEVKDSPPRDNDPLRLIGF